MDQFSEVEGELLSYISSMDKLKKVFRTLDHTVTKIHWGALITFNDKLVAELWVETKSDLLRALVSDYDKTSLLRLWNEVDKSLREDYECFIGISLKIQEVGLANEIVELVMHESKILGDVGCPPLYY